MDGIVKTEAQMKRSYNAYLKWREYWKAKGYKSDEKMTPEEYTEWHVSQMLMGGDPNIARTIARQELTYTATGAKKIAQRAKRIDYDEYEDEDVDIYDAAELMERRQNEKRKMIKEKYSNWRSIVAAEDREQVFLDLAAAEIDMDLWDYDKDTRNNLYSDDLKRFRQKFEADLYKENKGKK